MRYTYCSLVHIYKDMLIQFVSLHFGAGVLDCRQFVFLMEFISGYEARCFSGRGMGQDIGTLAILSHLVPYTATAILPFCVHDG